MSISGATQMRCLSWSAHCSRLLFTTIGLSRTVRYLAPCALPAVALLPVLAYRHDTYRCSLVTVAGTGLTLVMLMQMGFPGVLVARVVGLAPEYVTVLRAKSRGHGSAGLVQRRDWQVS